MAIWSFESFGHIVKIGRVRRRGREGSWRVCHQERNEEEKYGEQMVEETRARSREG